MKSAVNAVALFSLAAFSAGAALIGGHAAAEQQAAPPAKASPATATASPAVKPAPAGSLRQMRLVTTEQYLNTISNVFGVDAQPSTRFSPMQRVDGLLQLGTLKAGVSEADVELYQSAAQNVVSNALSSERRDFLLACRPANPKKSDDGCARQAFDRFGTLIFRRELKAGELERYVQVAADAGNRLNDFYRGLGVGLEALLVSPEALIVIEETEADPQAPGQQRLTAYSLASRLSYFLWNSAPDQSLLNAARTGELQTTSGRARAVDRMIASPRFIVGMRTFFSDMFALDDLDHIAKDALIYPDFTLATAADAREQLLRTIVDQTVVKKGDYRDLFTTRETFMSPQLAAIYEVPSTAGWNRFRFDEQSPRAGIQSLVGFLAGHAHPGRSSPTLRGRAIRELALCQRIPPPPPDVDFSALANPAAHGQTQRQRVADHLENPVCASCHRAMDPPGLALENFDGSGRFRRLDNGAEIDASGVIDGKSFNTPVEMAYVLRNNPTVPNCLVRRMYTFAVGETNSAAWRGAVSDLGKTFASNGFQIAALARQIAVGSSFSTIRNP